MNNKFLILNILIIKRIISQCSYSNCPIDNGKCIKNKCECQNNYITFNYNGIYCNYKKTSKWIPFILEIFFPSIGHFYLGKTYLGLIKLFFLIFPIFLSFLPCYKRKRYNNNCFRCISFIILFFYFI